MRTGWRRPCDLEAFEDRLAGALSQIQGAGEAQVVLTLKSGSRQVLAQDTQQGADGDSSSATVTLGRGSGSQEVVPLQTLAPQFQGALVVCPGGGDPEVCLRSPPSPAWAATGSLCVQVSRGTAASKAR